jgi:putative FmdB family regulatory protein
MPRYEFRCQDCTDLGASSVFEVTRPMSASGEPATCPAGHRNTVKLLSTVAMTSGSSAMSSGQRGGAGGGCCGGGCGCG